MVSDLFDVEHTEHGAASWLDLPGDKGCFRAINGFLSESEASHYFDKLVTDISWQIERLWMFGRWVESPRRVAWYGDPEAVYQYSGKRHQPLPWLPELSALRTAIERVTDHSFNSVLANLYRNGADSMGWHCDDEPELGESPIIASISLGAERFFDYRRKVDHQDKHRINLTSGCLLVMQGSSQKHWQHQIPKQRKVIQPRINLTFRHIIAGR